MGEACSTTGQTQNTYNSLATNYQEYRPLTLRWNDDDNKRKDVGWVYMNRILSYPILTVADCCKHGNEISGYRKRTGIS
jgi:hypothetical protein